MKQHSFGSLTYYSDTTSCFVMDDFGNAVVLKDDPFIQFVYFVCDGLDTIH